MQKYYKVLGIEYDAPLPEIKGAYRSLAKFWHPDRFGSYERLQRIAHEKMMELNEAYEMLCSITPAESPHHDVAKPSKPDPTKKPTNPNEHSQSHRHVGTPPQRPRRKASRRWQWYHAFGTAAVLLVAVVAVASLSVDSGPDRLKDVQNPANRSTHPNAYYFTLGSGKDEVWAAQGAPTEVAGNTWRYGYSMVSFENGRVVNWHDSPSDPLKVKAVPVELRSKERDYFSAGSTKDEVLAVQGTPNEFTDHKWMYGSSVVNFAENRVVSWYETPSHPLRVRMIPLAPAMEPRGYFSVGSSKDEVLSSQGTPSQFTEQVWRYGYSMIHFEMGRVVNWYSSPASPLRVKALAETERKRLKDHFSLGATKEEVLEVQGTPSEFTDYVWRYGFSLLYFENGRLAKWYDSPSNPIKVHQSPQDLALSNREYFTIGSTRDEVLAVQGMPNELSDSLWRYGFSEVIFENNRVVRWYNSQANPLKVTMNHSQGTSY